MFCPYCGLKAADGARFCRQCGTKLPEQKSFVPVTPDPVVPTPAPSEPEIIVEAPAAEQFPEVDVPTVIDDQEPVYEPLPDDEIPAAPEFEAEPEFEADPELTGNFANKLFAKDDDDSMRKMPMFADDDPISASDFGQTGPMEPAADSFGATGDLDSFGATGDMGTFGATGDLAPEAPAASEEPAANGKKRREKKPKAPKEKKPADKYAVKAFTAAGSILGVLIAVILYGVISGRLPLDPNAPAKKPTVAATEPTGDTKPSQNPQTPTMPADGTLNTSFFVMSEGNLCCVSEEADGSVSVEAIAPECAGVSDSIAVSSDYLYFLSCCDSDGSGNLCRIALNSLPDNTDALEEIASGVKPGFTCFSDNTVLFETTDPVLAFYDGSTVHTLAQNVTSFRVNGSKQVICITENSDGTLNALGITLGSSPDIVTMAENCMGIVSTDHFDTVLYAVGAEGREALYRASIDGSSEMLYDEIVILSVSDDRIAFAKTSDNVILLYDCVNDDMLSSDNNAIEPIQDNFLKPSYTYHKMEPKMDPAEYGGAFTSITKPNNFYTAWGGYQSIEFASTHSDYAKDIKAFMEKYQGLEDADGYFPVTPEIQKDLEHLAKLSGQGYDGEWKEFCFYREETGDPVPDPDAYKEAVEAYKKVLSRNEDREFLKDPANGIPTHDLFVTNGSDADMVYSGIMNFHTYGSGILYNPPIVPSDPVNRPFMMNVKTPADVAGMFELKEDADGNFFYSLRCDLPMALSANAAAKLAELDAFNSGISFTENDTQYILAYGDNSIYRAVTEEGVAVDFEQVADEVSSLQVTELGVIFICNDGAVCVLKDGEIRTVLEAADAGTVSVYADGTVLAISDGMLVLSDPEGNSSSIAGDVSAYARTADGKIAYISDYAAYLFDGSENSLVAEDVYYIWCANPEIPVCGF